MNTVMNPYFRLSRRGVVVLGADYGADPYPAR